MVFEAGLASWKSSKPSSSSPSLSMLSKGLKELKGAGFFGTAMPLKTGASSFQQFMIMLSIVRGNPKSILNSYLTSLRQCNVLHCYVELIAAQMTHLIDTCQIPYLPQYGLVYAFINKGRLQEISQIASGIRQLPSLRTDLPQQQLGRASQSIVCHSLRASRMRISPF